MILSNSDLAPALIVCGSFSITIILYYAYVVWYKTRQTQPGIRDKNVQIIHNSVDGLFNVEWSQRKKVTESGAPIKFIIPVIIYCMMIYFVAYLIAGYLVHLVLPNLFVADEYLVNYAISLFWATAAALIVIPLIRRWIILSSPEHKLVNWQLWLYRVTFSVQLVAFMSVVLATIPTNFGPISGLQYPILTLIVIFLPAVVVRSSSGRSFVFFPGLWTHEALASANYKEALQRVQRLDTKFSPDITVSLYRVTVQVLAGQYTEAEASFRQILQEAPYDYRYSTYTLTQALYYLGYSLLRQDHYPEATRAFQGALELNPKADYVVSGLAEVYLFQGIQPQSALDLIVDFQNKKAALGNPADPYRMFRGAVLGDKAWALTLMGKQAKAEETIEEALRRVNKSFKPGLAGLHYRAGQVYKQNKQARAVKDFERAVALDPEGSWGQLARQALQELGHTPQTPIVPND